MEMHGRCRCIRCSSYCGMLSLAIRWSSISQVRVETTIRSELSASTVFKEKVSLTYNPAWEQDMAHK